MGESASRLRAVISATALLALTACTGGINAGEDGGLAFIVFTGMLLAFLGILWLVLGRED